MWNTSPKKERCTKRNETKAHRSRPGFQSRMKAFKSLAIGTRNRSFRLGEGLGVALVQENIDCSPDIGLFTRRDGTTQHEVDGLFIYFSLSAFKEISAISCSTSLYSREPVILTNYSSFVL